MMMQIASIAMANLMMMGNLTTAETRVMEIAPEVYTMETAPEVYATETGILLNFPDGTGYYIEF